MGGNLKIYLDAILNERSWSWTIAGIFYLIFGMAVRNCFLKPLLGRAKRELAKPLWKEVKGNYYKNSFLGWLFFCIPFGIVVFLWYEGIQMQREELTIPHPRMLQRDFVLRPFKELAPQLVEGLLHARH